MSDNKKMAIVAVIFILAVLVEPMLTVWGV